MDAGTKQASGWLDSIKDSFENLFNQLEFSWAKITEYGVALGGGILVGFLVRRFGRQTIIIFIVFIAVLAGLNYFELIAIDWTKVKEFVGLAPAETVEAFFKDYWQWAKIHIVAVIVSVVGFVIGYKIG